MKLAYNFPIKFFFQNEHLKDLTFITRLFTGDPNDIGISGDMGSVRLEMASTEGKKPSAQDLEVVRKFLEQAIKGQFQDNNVRFELGKAELETAQH